MIAIRYNPSLVTMARAGALHKKLERHDALLVGKTVRFPDGSTMPRPEFEAWDEALNGRDVAAMIPTGPVVGDRDGIGARLRSRMRELGLARHMHEGIVAHVLDGRPTGGFLTAVLCDRLSEAVLAADDDNRRRIVEWATLLRSLPADAWGSIEIVKAWRERGGMRGEARS